MKSPTSDLQWFHENAGLILSDMDRCPDQLPPRPYWDTSEVHGSAIGYADLYSKTNEFNSRKFESNEYLVRCLMASGWFGTIEMLEPHKFEFITRIGHFLDAERRDPHSRRPSVVTPTDFLRASTRVGDSSSVTVSNISRFIKDQSGRADALFKAIQSLGSFEQRVSIWRRMQLLSLTYDSAFEYGSIIENRQFERLRRVLDVERPETPINNFTDAAALCLLQERMHRAIEDGAPIPILFVSSSPIRDAALSVKAEGFLTYKDGKGKDVSVLRSANYYLLRASLWVPERFRSSSTLSDPIPELREMWELADGYVGFASRANLLGPDSYVAIDSRLAEKIGELKKLWFLDRVWIPFAIDKTTVEIATPFLSDESRVLDAAKALSDNNAYRAAILRDVEDLRNRFKAGARQYTYLVRTWIQIHESFERFLSYYSYLSDVMPVSISSLFGLVRFGLPEDVERSVEEEVVTLLGPEDIRKKAIGDIIMRCLAVLRAEGTSRRFPGSLIVVLWVLEDDATIDDLIQTRLDSDIDLPMWIHIVHAASLLRAQKGEARVGDILGKLRRGLDDESDVGRRVQIMIGIAYLHFHIWENGGKTRLWTFRAFRSDGRGGEEIPSDKNIQDAVQWALRARNNAPIGSARYVYSLNLFVYYATEAPDSGEFDRAEEYVAELLGYKENRSLWQYRFDDTLARFYHRRAMDRSGRERKENLVKAMSYIEEAVRMGRGDRRVGTYREQLKLILDRATEDGLSNA